MPLARPLIAALACVVVAVPGCSRPAHRATTVVDTPTPSATAGSTGRPTPSAPRASAPVHSTMATVEPHPSPPRTSAAGRGLPLAEPTGQASDVLTVVAASRRSTTAILQAWTKRSGGWTRFGTPVTAWLGSDGLSDAASESSTATPIGSFTLTQAFGSQADPGTALPYLRTTPADWWISEPGALYNTEQRCSGRCPFTQGEPNEHLYYTQPFYRYAVVIDYNTRNAPGGVHQGAGSAFFLHVTVGEPTAGCVSIPEATLTALMRWLTPTAHPRILIGVA